MKLFITSAAESDLDEIEAFIAADNPDAAARFLDVLEDRFDLIAHSPGIGRRREKYAPGVRSLAEGNYVIIYRLKGGTIQILRVLHGARDPERVIRLTPIEE